MPAKTLYFAEVGPVWQDWIQVINVGNGPARVAALARDGNAAPIWSKEGTISPFHSWRPPVEEITVQSSLQITSDQFIVAERHMHRGTEVLDFPGASIETKTAGRRLFFPELSQGARDWFRILNISNDAAHATFIIRNADGNVVLQRSQQIKSFGWWTIDDKMTGDARGTVEVTSTQPVVAERHLHYQGGKVAVGSLGQVLES